MSEWITPPKFAEQLGIKPEKVIAWIRRGELKAVNVADRLGSRPRWRMSPEALSDFLRPRESQPPTITKRRQAYQPQYFTTAL